MRGALSRARAKTILTVLVALVGLYFGLSQRNLNQLLNWINRPPSGTYRVLAIHDGDTVTVDMSGREQRVRFIGVDTPELHHPDRPVQCFGEAARQHLTELIDGQPVKLESDPLSNNRDRYDRLLRYAYLPDGTLLNARQVSDGYGFAYLSFPFTKSAEFELLELRARAESRGLWSKCEVNLKNGYPTAEPA